MDGLAMTNAQGNYNQGRGADGLGFVRPLIGSRYGSAVPYSLRPPAISGKATPAPSLDPRIVIGPYVPGTGTRPDKIFDQDQWRAPSWKIRRPPIFVPPTPPRQRRRPRRIRKAKKIRDRQAFINWLKNWAPQLYADAKRKADTLEITEGSLGQLGGWWETFTDSITDLGGKYLQFRTQKEILEAQLSRMREGLPPLQTSEYAPTIAIKPDPGTTREIVGAIGTGFGKMLPFIAIGGVALLLLMRRK